MHLCPSVDTIDEALRLRRRWVGEKQETPRILQNVIIVTPVQHIHGVLCAVERRHAKQTNISSGHNGSLKTDFKYTVI